MQSLGLSSPSPETRLQRHRCRADQKPGHACWGMEKLNLAVQAAPCHRFHNYGAEPAPLRTRAVRCAQSTSIEPSPFVMKLRIVMSPSYRRRTCLV